MSSKVTKATKSKGAKAKTAVDYLPDADEIERSPLPRFAQFTLHILMGALVAFLLWASLAQLEQVVAAQGSLVNPLPNIVVQPLETSIIQSINVKAGQLVKKGDTMATLDATFIRADENQLRLRLESLETQAKGLDEELSGKSPAAVAADSWHPADLNRNWTLEENEALHYMERWQKGAVPMVWAVRTGFLSRAGHSYVFDASKPMPDCWSRP